jgi:hypothetical protein
MNSVRSTRARVPLPGWMHATLMPIAADRTIKVVLPPR